ncbi:MAG TPA: prolipoprotein diacylglyceryl transferase [Acetobacteraceae bacterium]|nr:prolipoprotein diacylglyceryl transferase [Acetobacteraceae bacterium]
MMSVLVFPNFNPVAVHLGPFAIRWYALAYIAALLLGWRLLSRLVRETPKVATALEVDDFLSWATLGVVLGGRLGYVLFYQPAYYFTHPLMIAAVWDGGMSFHGGLIGVVVAIIWFCRRNGIAVLGFADRIAVTVPIGLFLGRIANFINGELWGRPAPRWWPLAVIYPRAGPIPRFPSELYEALLEGAALFLVLYWLSRREAWRVRGGFLTGSFLLGYAIARITGEFFRQPDWFLGYLLFGITMGQLLSLPLIPIGIWLIATSRRRLVPEREEDRPVSG